MEVAISGKGYVFRGQTAGVAVKVFQACGVARVRQYCGQSGKSDNCQAAVSLSVSNVNFEFANRVAIIPAGTVGPR